MTSKEVKTHIIDTINGDMVKEYFINEILPEILKKLERLENLERWEWEELENDRLLDQAEKEELERKNAVLNHNLEEKVEIIFELEKENQELKSKYKDLMLDFKMFDFNPIKQENEKLKQEYEELSKDELCFEKRCDKLEKAIELLKDMFNINLWVDDMDCYIRIGKCDYLISWEQYKILSEMLE